MNKALAFIQEYSLEIAVAVLTIAFAVFAIKVQAGSPAMTIYFEDGTSYTLDPNETVYIAKKPVYTRHYPDNGWIIYVPVAPAGPSEEPDCITREEANRTLTRGGIAVICEE